MEVLVCPDSDTPTIFRRPGLYCINETGRLFRRSLNATDISGHSVIIPVEEQQR